MAAWGPYLTRILTIQAYTVASCLAIAAVGYLLLVARHRSAAGARGARMRRGRWRGGAAATIGAFAVVAIVLGGFFFYNANILNAYTEVHVAEKRVKAWELEYKKLDSLPQPRLVSVSLRHDYFPEQRAAKWNGTLRAVNRNARRGRHAVRQRSGDRSVSREPLRGDRRAPGFTSIRWRSIAPRRSFATT